MFVQKSAKDKNNLLAIFFPSIAIKYLIVIRFVIEKYSQLQFILLLLQI